MKENQVLVNNKVAHIEKGEEMINFELESMLNTLQWQ